MDSLDRQLELTMKYYRKPAIISFIPFLCLVIAWMVTIICTQSLWAVFCFIPFVILSFVFFMIFSSDMVQCLQLKSHCERTRYEIINSHNISETFQGPQGVGKSEYVKNAACQLADYNATCINNAYVEGINSLRIWQKDNDWNKLDDFKQVEETWRFYHEHPEIYPGICTDFPMVIDGRPTLQLSVAHRLQKKKLPWHCVLVHDEMRTYYSARDSKDCPKILECSFKYDRQFYCARVLGVDQDVSGVILGHRKVTMPFTIDYMARYLEPKSLIRKRDKLRSKLIEECGIPSLKYRTPICGYVVTGDGKTYNLHLRLKKVRRIRCSHYSDGRTGSAVHSYMYRRSKKVCYSYKRLFQVLQLKTNVEFMYEINRLNTLISKIGFIGFNIRGCKPTQENFVNVEEKRMHVFPANRRYDSSTRLFKGLNQAANLSISCNKSWMNAKFDLDDFNEQTHLMDEAFIEDAQRREEVKKQKKSTTK